MPLPVVKNYMYTANADITRHYLLFTSLSCKVNNKEHNAIMYNFFTNLKHLKVEGAEMVKHFHPLSAIVLIKMGP